MAERIFNVQLLRIGNKARSIRAESIMRKEGRGRFRAFSAGSHPKGVVIPSRSRCSEASNTRLTAYVRNRGRNSRPPARRSWIFVFTVCDNAAGEACPIRPGQPMTAHGGVEDPAAVEGADLEKEAAFVLAARFLRNRISAFVNLPLRSIDESSLNKKLREIAALEGASKSRPEVA